MPFEKTTTNATWLKLFAVILLAVAGGNLLSNWVTARVVEWQMRQAAAELSDEMRRQGERVRQDIDAGLKRSRAEAQAAGDRLREARREDKVGARLARACADWTKANAELASYTTRTEQQKACARLEAYVDSGVLPAP